MSNLESNESKVSPTLHQTTLKKDFASLWTEAHKAGIKSELDLFREHLPEHREKVEEAGDRIKRALYNNLLREGDPEISDLTAEMAKMIESSVFDIFTANEFESPENLKAALIGAKLVLDSRAQTRPQEIPKSHYELAKRFLKLTQSRVGKINLDTGEPEIQNRIELKLESE